MHSRRIVQFGLSVLAALVLFGCGSSTGKTTTGTTTGTPSGFGTPGDAAKASRTLEVHIASRPLAYNPASFMVMPGETVLFKVTNDTGTYRDFVLGDQKAQDDYQKVMDGMGTAPMAMPDKSNILNLNAGVTKQLAWTFPDTPNLTVIFASHQPGDFAAGLRGTVTVTPNAAATPTTMGGMTTTTMGGTATTMGGMTTTTMDMGSMPMTSTTMKP